jgi:RNA polymerase sigma-70 factor (ECF subfamily)
MCKRLHKAFSNMSTATIASAFAPAKPKARPQSTDARSDEQLLCALAQHDDARALEMLFQRHYAGLCRYVYAILKCRHTTEEVVSDVFLKIWNQRHTLHIQSSLKAYLLIAVRNLSIDYLRRSARRRTVGADAIHPDLPCAYTSATDQVIGDESARIVEAAIERLPKQGKIIFRLSRDGGMKYREIAEHLGLSIKTVETHMTRSLVFLRQEVSEKLGFRAEEFA